MTNPASQPRSILVQDGAPSMKPKKPSGGLKADDATSGTRKKSGERTKSSSAAKGSTPTEGKFLCPRCHRTDFTSAERFQDHCSKCAL